MSGVLDPRLQFKLRTLQNWAWCMAGFALVAICVAPLPFRGLVDMAGIATAYYILFFVLDKRAGLIECPHCNNKLATNTPWVCGLCGKKNLRVEDFPFTNRCQHCGTEPKAYQCHHRDCGQLIFFTEDRQEENFAFCLVPQAPEPPPVDKRVVRTEQKEEIQHEIEMARSTLELERIQQERAVRKRTRKEQIEESFLNYRGTVLGARVFAREWAAQKRTELKDDPDALQDELDTLDAWLRDKGID